MAGQPSLDEYAASNSGRNVVRWCDKLPEDVKAQILASDASCTVVVRWLQSLGYEEASYGKVQTWRQAERERQPE